MAHWKSVKVDEDLFKDVEQVFPYFWKLCKKELNKKKAVPKKGAMLKSQVFLTFVSMWLPFQKEKLRMT